MPSQRLFIAISPPPAVRAVLSGLNTRLRGVRWTPPEQLHVTLRFLGDTEKDLIPSLVDRLSTIKVEPFLLPVEGVGAFPSARAPRVLWVGIGSGHPRLHQLRQQIDDALLALPLKVDVRTFHPHLTMARCGDSTGGGAAHWLRTHHAFEGPPFAVDAFDLYSSELRPNGSVHTVVARFPLSK